MIGACELGDSVGLCRSYVTESSLANKSRQLVYAHIRRVMVGAQSRVYDIRNRSVVGRAIGEQNIRLDTNGHRREGRRRRRQ